MGGREDYNRCAGSLTPAVGTCSQCALVDPKYHPVTLDCDTSVLMLLQQ